MGARIKVLITIKTYPLPSEKYDELVCTGGVREDGTFIRLYPIDFRYRDYGQWFRKYEWVEVEVEKNAKDPRPESFRPIGDIRPTGKVIGTSNNWSERKKYVLARPINTMCELNGKNQQEVSLGLVRPLKVYDFIIESVDRDWKPQWQALFRQVRLFGPDRKPLEKIPYKFSYKFRCEEQGCKGHTMMNEDWEVGELYRRMRDEYKDEEIACAKVKQTLLDKMCAPNRDTHFFVGTVLQHNRWIVIGCFWPKKVNGASNETS